MAAPQVDKKLVRFASPFRYPGGKGALTPLLATELERRFGDEKANFAEPFCGGAGAAMNLLASNRVGQIYLNDADSRIFSAWKAMLTETERFLDKLLNVAVNIENWYYFNSLIHLPSCCDYDFNIGFATFFINRTSRSGVVEGSGPIGGYLQNGNWPIDARFNKIELSHRIERIGQMRERIHLYHSDAIEFLNIIEKQHDIDNTFLFIDPPYMKAGGRLYYNGMNLNKHSELSEWLLSRSKIHWILTYDDHPEVRKNYSNLKPKKSPIKYSLSRRRIENELMYSS